MEIRFDGCVRDIFRNYEIPTIYDITKTVEMLSETGNSFSRFGDGEFKLLTESGVDHMFQRGGVELSESLKNILTTENENVEVGINRIYFYNDGFEHPYIENFIYNRGYGKLALKYGYAGYLKRRHYYDSVFSIPYHHYVLPKEFFDGYFESVKNIWKGKHILLVTGDVDMIKYKYSIFDTSKSMDFIEISKKNAFDYRKRILYAISKRLPKRKNRDYVVLFACGLAATVLSFDIGSEGKFQSIDIGHLAREYYIFKEGIVPYSKSDINFFDS